MKSFLRSVFGKKPINNSTINPLNEDTLKELLKRQQKIVDIFTEEKK